MVRKRVLAPLLHAATLLAYAARAFFLVWLALERRTLLARFALLLLTSVAAVELSRAATDACYFLLVHDDARVQEHRDLGRTWYWYAVTRRCTDAGRHEDCSLGGGKN